MTIEELARYHASEGGLIDADIVRELAHDSEIDVSGLDVDQIADDANGYAIVETLRGNVLGARIFKTEDGYRFAEMACGTITDGDVDWTSESAFAASMSDHGIEYSVMRVA